MKKLDSVFWGISFVLYGFVWCLIVLGFLNVGSFVSGWSMFFVLVPCLLCVSFGKHMLENLIGLIFSVFILFLINGLINFLLLIQLFVPLLVIIIGFYLIKRGK